MTYITILWTHDPEKQETSAFDYQEHEQLKDAVLYLIQHGAQYKNQKIVTEVDWLPGESTQIAQPTPTPQVTAPQASQNDEEIGPPPGTIMGPVEQPQVMDPTGMTQPTGGGYRPPRPGQKSIFDGVLPPFVTRAIQADND